MGEVYVMTNISMPGLVKVGRSASAAERVRQLSQATAVPTEFELRHVEAVEDDADVERLAHALLAEVRVNERREFFYTSAKTAAKAVQLAALLSLWNNAPAVVRAEFMLRIDRPVFDSSEAGRAA